MNYANLILVSPKLLLWLLAEAVRRCFSTAIAGIKETLE